MESVSIAILILGWPVFNLDDDQGDVVFWFRAFTESVEIVDDPVGNIGGTGGRMGANEVVDPLFTEHVSPGTACFPDAVRADKNNLPNGQAGPLVFFVAPAPVDAQRYPVAAQLLEMPGCRGRI